MKSGSKSNGEPDHGEDKARVSRATRSLRVLSVGALVVSAFAASTAAPTFARTAAVHPDVIVPVSMPINISALLNNVGVENDANNVNPSGNFDGNHDAYSAQSLAAPTSGQPLTPGGTVASPDGVTYTLPATWADSNDNVVALGQSVTPPANTRGTAIAFLGASTYGPATGTGTITYADNTTQSFTLAENDWTNTGSQPYETQVTATNRRDVVSGTTVMVQPAISDVYSYLIPLVNTANITSIKLPSAGAAAVMVPSLHIFALTVVDAAGPAATATAQTGQTQVAGMATAQANATATAAAVPATATATSTATNTPTNTPVAGGAATATAEAGFAVGFGAMQVLLNTAPSNVTHGSGTVRVISAHSDGRDANGPVTVGLSVYEKIDGQAPFLLYRTVVSTTADSQGRVVSTVPLSYKTVPGATLTVQSTILTEYHYFANSAQYTVPSTLCSLATGARVAWSTRLSLQRGRPFALQVNAASGTCLGLSFFVVKGGQAISPSTVLYHATAAKTVNNYGVGTLTVVAPRGGYWPRGTVVLVVRVRRPSGDILITRSYSGA